MINKIKELYAYREMIISLVRKDLRARYKGSALGFLWSFLNPFLQLIVYTLVFSYFLRFNIEKYYLFLFVALVPWTFFASSIIGGASVIMSQKSLVTKIYFPREVIPLAFVTTGFINMLYSFVIVFLVVFFSGVEINLLAFLCLPIIMILQYVLVLGFAMIFSSITVYVRDLEHILGVVVMAWQFLTPVMYPIDIVPGKFVYIFMLNPMTPIVIAYRDILYYSRIPDFGTLIQVFLFAIFFLLLGFYVFDKLQKGFAEEL